MSIVCALDIRCQVELKTLTQHLQYMSRVDDSKYHKTKVFLYAKGSFLEEGRHDCTVEVWTVPAPDREKGNWRQEQVCLARCTQFAWALPVSSFFPFWFGCDLAQCTITAQREQSEG